MSNQINTNLNLKHYPFPSIEQFSNVIFNIKRDLNFDLSTKVKYLFTCKSHGTNAAAIIDFKNDIIYFQSRERVISVLSDNAGFATYMSKYQKDLIDMIKSNLDISNIDWSKNILAIYFEMCGGNIQKGIALSQLDKMAIVIGVATIDIETNQKNWFSIEETHKYKIPSLKIYNIYDFKTYEFEIDFNNYNGLEEKFAEIVTEIENECPIGKYFGITGIGEGFVAKPIDANYNSGFWFKCKGEKHAMKKVNSIKPVDDEKINKLINIANKITKSWRLEQMFNETFDVINGGIPDRKKIKITL